MTKVAYFAHDWTDAAILRRVKALQDDGLSVLGFAMTRDYGNAPDWVIAKLGTTRDNAYFQRALSVFRGAWNARKNRQALGTADVIIARNLDMLATAMLARRLCNLKTPVIYECLDVHRLLVRKDFIGILFRKLEGYLLKGTSALWVSSPGFLRNYFDIYHKDKFFAQLIENRMTAGGALVARPQSACEIAPSGKLRIGWFGNLRCARSLRLLEGLAARFGDQIELHFHGYPALGEIPDFQSRVDVNPHIFFGGRYRAPDDLARLYDSVDVVWSGDFMDEGYNSDWLLPNRIYEGGYFACPPIAPATTETGARISRDGSGFTLVEPLEDSFPMLISDLLTNRNKVEEAQAVLLDQPDECFIQPAGTLNQLVREALTT